jgi:hypothetical protein
MLKVGRGVASLGYNAASNIKEVQDDMHGFIWLFL